MPVKSEISPRALRLLLVILRAADLGQTLTNRELAARLGHRGLGEVERLLEVLRRAGLVSPSTGSRTIRPSCRMVLFKEKE